MEQEENEDIDKEATTATWTLRRHIGEVPAMAAGGADGMVTAGGVMAEDLHGHGARRASHAVVTAVPHCRIKHRELIHAIIRVFDHTAVS